MKRRKILSIPLAVAAISAASGIALPPAAAAAPSHVRTIGHSGQAEIYPSGVDVDAAGAVYVADTGNDRLAKYPAGSTVAAWSVDTRRDSKSVSDGPRDVAVGSSRVYVANLNNVSVQVFDLDGRYLSDLDFPFKSPIGVSVGADGAGGERVLVSDGKTANVEVFDAAGNHLLTVPSHLGTGSATRDAATDSAGNIYAADYINARIEKYTPAGTWLMEWGTTGASSCARITKPYGVDVDANDRIYVAASSGDGNIKVFNPDGSCVRSYGVRGQGEFELSQLRRVAVGAGPAPKVYAADLWGIKILTYNVDGSLAAPARLGSSSYPPAGGLNEVHGVAVSGTHVFAVDTVNQRIDRFDLDGANPISWGTKGVATDQFNWPAGAAVHPLTGNLWVADTRNGRLVEYGQDGGSPLRVHGSVGSGNGQFRGPMGLSFDPSGAMYVADTENGRIQSFDSNLAFRWAHSTQAGGSALKRPWALAYDPAGGRVIVADTGNDRLVTLDPATGARTGQLPMGPGAGEGQLDQPMGVAAAPDGSIWVADTGNNRVQGFNPDGSFAGAVIGGGPPGAGNDQLNFPMQLTFGPDGLLYVADMYNNRIQVFRVSPETPAPAPFNPRYQSEISDPEGIAPLYPAGGAADAAGNSYVADTGNERIIRIAPDGSQTTVASEGLNHPRGVAIDPDPAYLWVADTTDNQILQMTTGGTVIKTFGGQQGYVNAPFALSADVSGVYIADTYNQRAIKVAKTDGALLWATATCSGLAMVRPRGIAVSEGSVYVADTGNNRLVVLDPATGACLRVIGSQGSGPGKFRKPVGVAGDGAGGLWVGDDDNDRVQHLRNDGAFIAQTTTGGGDGPGQFQHPAWVWTLPSPGGGAAMAVSDTNAWRIHIFNVDAAGAPAYSRTLGGVPPAPGGFNQPYGAAYGPAGELYVVDMFNHRVQKFNPDGTFALQWGIFGSHNGGFQFPRGIALSPDGQTVVVTDSENNRLDLFSSTGAFVRSVKPTGTQLLFPQQAAPAPDGTYWIADTSNRRILHLGGDGTVLANWNDGGAMRTPRGIALDAAGNVYVADAGTNLVRKFDAAGARLATLATSGSGPTNVASPANLTITGTPGAERLWIADSGNARVIVLGLDGAPLGSFGGAGTGPGHFQNPVSVGVSSLDGRVAVPDFDLHRVSLWTTL